MHFHAIVLVRPETEDVQAEVERLMAPYSEHDCTDSCNDEESNYSACTHWWDWWRIGGRWDGVLLGLERLPEATHYTSEWEQLDRNIIPVRDLEREPPATLVTPDGEVFHGYDYSSERCQDTDYKRPEFPREYIEKVLQYRDCLAVSVDYHS